MRKTKICINAQRIPKYITTIKAANEVEIEVLQVFLLLETCDLTKLSRLKHKAVVKRQKTVRTQKRKYIADIFQSKKQKNILQTADNFLL